MADIFLSYKKTDAARVQPIVETLEANGWSVWWDTRIGAGEQWDEVIEREISQAKCVVVVWSNESVSSRWVRTEASEGLERSILIPLLVDDVVQPLAFRLTQATSLKGWSPGSADKRWDSVLTSITALVGSPIGRSRPAQSSTTAPPEYNSSAASGIWIDIGTRGAGVVRELKARQSFVDFDGGPELIVIPPGQVLMGPPIDAYTNAENARPQHAVSISRPFAVGKFPITVGQYDRFISDTGYVIEAKREVWKPAAYLDENSDGEWVLEKIYHTQPVEFSQGPDHPVVLVGWRDAKAYAIWASKKTGRNYRLLTEAEWEYAARAGTTTPYWWGSSPSPTNATFDASRIQKKGRRGYAHKGTTEVTKARPNPFGLCDMLGNVEEWVEDWFAPLHEGTPNDGSARLTPGILQDRVVRGGSWASSPDNVRCDRRAGARLYLGWPTVGFRVARDV